MATVENLKNELAAPKDKPQTFPAMLEAFKGEIVKALPKHINGDRMCRIALTAFRRTPKLQQCDPRSLFAAVIQASQLGLEPDTLGRSYIIPYGAEATFVPGWKGLVDLMNRSGNGTIYTGAIFKDQSYTFTDGARRDLVIHNETSLDDPADITHAYAIGWIKGAQMPIIELWRVEKIIKHRDRYNKVGKRHYSYENWEAYARKVPLLQVLKYMPMSAELATAVELNYAAESGAQNLTVKDAIEGTWTPAPQEETPEPGASAANAAASNAPRSTVTFAQVAEAMNRAKDIEVLEVAADLIGEVTDAGQRKELTEMFGQLKAKFK